MNWAATNPDIDVINLSLGGVGPSTVLEAAINRADSNGKLVVAAAGNQGTDELTYPAAFERVIGVGAVDAGKVRASYSNFGGSVDLVAPGGDAAGMQIWMAMPILSLAPGVSTMAVNLSAHTRDCRVLRWLLPRSGYLCLDESCE